MGGILQDEQDDGLVRPARFGSAIWSDAEKKYEEDEDIDAFFDGRLYATSAERGDGRPGTCKLAFVGMDGIECIFSSCVVVFPGLTSN